MQELERLNLSNCDIGRLWLSDGYEDSFKEQGITEELLFTEMASTVSKLQNLRVLDISENNLSRLSKECLERGLEMMLKNKSVSEIIFESSELDEKFCREEWFVGLMKAYEFYSLDSGDAYVWKRSA